MKARTLLDLLKPVALESKWQFYDDAVYPIKFFRVGDLGPDGQDARYVDLEIGRFQPTWYDVRVLTGDTLINSCSFKEGEMRSLFAYVHAWLTHTPEEWADILNEYVDVPRMMEVI